MKSKLSCKLVSFSRVTLCKCAVRVNRKEILYKKQPCACNIPIESSRFHVPSSQSRNVSFLTCADPKEKPKNWSSRQVALKVYQLLFPSETRAARSNSRQSKWVQLQKRAPSGAKSTDCSFCFQRTSSNSRWTWRPSTSKSSCSVYFLRRFAKSANFWKCRLPPIWKLFRQFSAANEIQILNESNSGMKTRFPSSGNNRFSGGRWPDRKWRGSGKRWLPVLSPSTSLRGIRLCRSNSYRSIGCDSLSKQRKIEYNE